MPVITVRPATLSDIDTLVELMRDFYAESAYQLDRAWAARAFAELLSDPSRGAVWVLGVDAVAVGHAVLSFRFAMEFGGLSAYIDDLFVRAAYRRRGVARAALEALVAESIHRGCRSLHVEVDPKNVAAGMLYREFRLAPGTDERVELKTTLSAPSDRARTAPVIRSASTTADSTGTTLVAAEPKDELLLSNLLELYIHDLSAAFPHIPLGPDGRFGYPQLPLYFSEPDRRFAFLIHHESELAGFALVTRGSPLSRDPDVYDVAEFFVLRRYRRARVGQGAASLLWSHLPGKWIVRVSRANPSALACWSKVVADFTDHTARQSAHPGRTAPWQTFEFESPVST